MDLNKLTIKWSNYMNKILFLVLMTINLTYGADIKFKFNNRMASLIDSYDNDDLSAIDEFYEIFAVNDTDTPKSIAKDIICIDIKEPTFVLKAISEISEYLDTGLFEDHTIKANISNNANYPVELSLHDMGNSWDIGIVNVALCNF